MEVKFKFSKMADELTPSQLYGLLAGELKRRWETVESEPFGASLKSGVDDKGGEYTWYTTCLLNDWVVSKKDEQVYLWFGGSREAFFARTPFRRPDGLHVSIEWDHIEIWSPSGWLADGELVEYQTSTPPEWKVLFSERIRQVEEEPEKAVILNYQGYPRRVVPYNKNYSFK